MQCSGYDLVYVAHSWIPAPFSTVFNAECFVHTSLVKLHKGFTWKRLMQQCKAHCPALCGRDHGTKDGTTASCDGAKSQRPCNSSQNSNSSHSRWFLHIPGQTAELPATSQTPSCINFAGNADMSNMMAQTPPQCSVASCTKSSQICCLRWRSATL